MTYVGSHSPQRRPFDLRALLLSLRGKKVARHAVAELPAHLLRDVGVSRRDYRGATGGLYWDAPDHWFDDPARR